MFKRILHIVIHLTIVMVPIGLLVWLVIVDLTPSGRFVVRHRVDQLSPYVDRFLPDTRVGGVQQGEDGAFQLVVDEPAYAAVHAPGDFQTLEATLRFQNDSQPIIELGILMNEQPLQYELKPIQNLLIDNSPWERLEAEGLVLLQRSKIYGTIDDFIASPPDRDSLATYHYDFAEPLVIPDYVAQNALTTTEISLRGYHEYYTYIKNEPLLLQADFMDMNREEGEDVVTLLLFNASGERVAETTLADDGDVSDSQIGSSVRSLALVKDQLPEGVYKVILKANRDIFFRRLITRQRYMTFVGSVYLGDEVGYREEPRSVKFWTDTKYLSFYTYHADAAERITIGTGSLALPESQVRYDFEVADPGVVPVSADAGDFVVTQDGLLAFSTHQLFHPTAQKLTATTDVDKQQINFIIAKYASPVSEGAWLTATARFDLADALSDADDIKLVLSAPQIKPLQRQFKLHGIDLKFTRPAISALEFWNKLRDRVL